MEATATARRFLAEPPTSPTTHRAADRPAVQTDDLPASSRHPINPSLGRLWLVPVGRPVITPPFDQLGGSADGGRTTIDLVPISESCSTERGIYRPCQTRRAGRLSTIAARRQLWQESNYGKRAIMARGQLRVKCPTVSPAIHCGGRKCGCLVFIITSSSH